jgi:hypothetical protein
MVGVKQVVRNNLVVVIGRVREGAASVAVAQSPDVRKPRCPARSFAADRLR